jgi:hypothetical protein
MRMSTVKETPTISMVDYSLKILMPQRYMVDPQLLLIQTLNHVKEEVAEEISIQVGQLELQAYLQAIVCNYQLNSHQEEAFLREMQICP